MLFAAMIFPGLVFGAHVGAHVGHLLLAPPPASLPGDEWPRWRGPRADGTWNERGVVEKFSGEKLEPRWRVPISGGYSGPTVAGGRVYVTDRAVEPEEIEGVHCFAWETGESLWSYSYECVYAGVGYEAGPRASVLVHADLAYALGTMGHLHCFDAASGELRWAKDLNAEYSIRMPIWGIAAAPVIEGDLLIVPTSGEDACLVAFDRESGEERWKGLSDRGNYSTPIVIEQAGQRVLVHWTGDRIVGLDPATGAERWAHPYPSTKMPLGVASPVLVDDHLYFSGFYDGSLLLRLSQEELAVEEVWRRRGQSERNTDALHSIISTPLALDGHAYGVDSYGELRCLDLSDGDRVWEDDTAVPRARWATIHFVQNADHTWMFNDRGELIIASLSPDGFEELSRTQLIEPTRGQLNRRDGVCWSHPAFAHRHVFIRNDVALLCASLEASPRGDDESPSCLLPQPSSRE